MKPSKEADAKTHEFEVEGVGQFVAHYTTARRSIEIARRCQDILGGERTGDEGLAVRATALATAEVLLVSGPPEFEIDYIDPFNDDDLLLLLKINRSLRDAEETFRKERASARA